MNLGLAGKRVIVTGAGRGIGKAICLCLAKEGAIIAAASRTAGDIEKLLGELGGEKEGHMGVAIDLEPDGAPEKFVNILKEGGFSPIDIVVHNLGGTLDIKDPFCSLSDWRRLYRFNFEIPVELNNILVPGMQTRKWGRVVHISSISAMENHGPVTYCAMKAALTAYSRSLGGVVAPDGVVISAVLPGAVFTEEGYWDITSKENPEHVKKFLTERQRIGRFGTTSEIGNYVTFLCSELASFNTGSIVPVDGGQGRGYFGQ
ncbi:MAG: SDR family oxidoreductase [Proteobacteria bacterium]|nr:SDR family oxidoreductase [Pseudomonadota bacterium]MBU1388906.1 SDR family oxidoreductase [Pseudomonadota bacterium]MBU1543458.1 SDR family oxidoreductase [Pseudomonadota bacterium]MBU2430683.1 SDR family oxidoreductase [Pseudomonadota bacterium]MBU2480771.1 SDR family oxidoreductase [Pseudomonadota bacterium]